MSTAWVINFYGISDNLYYPLLRQEQLYVLDLKKINLFVWGNLAYFKVIPMAHVKACNWQLDILGLLHELLKSHQHSIPGYIAFLGEIHATPNGLLSFSLLH